MVLWVGVDDTDSLRGMCTTFLATEIVRALTPAWDLIGYPRLVRLNPNIPWKTRGNGALALRFGRGSGIPASVGFIGSREVFAYARAHGREKPEVLQETLDALVKRWAVFDDPTTNPAYVILRSQTAADFYRRTVRGIVTRREARAAARGLGIVRAFKNGRGVIGATAAVAWHPRDRTYEILAYRSPERWGQRREIDPSSVIEMDRAFPSTFNNYDDRNGKIVLAPHSPCPVLLGIRGDCPEDLIPALISLRTEKPERALIFETNQGTDDHIRRDNWSLLPATATSVRGRVASFPLTRSGGHVLVGIRGRRAFTAAAYEPSKEFRDVVRALRPGDRVRVWGSIRDVPRTLNLEKIQILALAEDRRKVANPICPMCGKSMKSLGSGAGFRCARGHARLPSSAAIYAVLERNVQVGYHEPPACARRHLSKPLKRLLPGRVERVSASVSDPTS